MQLLQCGDVEEEFTVKFLETNHTFLISSQDIRQLWAETRNMDMTNHPTLRKFLRDLSEVPGVLEDGV